ncbi:PASTA domain-containing protein [Mangrovibacterium diazotrophicum]|uniref:PASTA domain-containing protein n=1 Tax=Mangrovibacterium diazotrophicum TaxID=1261403 RepID=UPI0014729ED5|nr:PASTA domain-containing protein [Mangrovibacterium diazotrophicum]
MTSRTFFIQLAIAIAIIVVLLLLTMFGIRKYTNHGESQPVPDLAGLNIEQAEQLLASKNLTYEISDSTYLDSAEPGSVIGQMPQAGHSVKEGRTIFLSICAIAPEQVAMPKLTDISFRQAVNIMQAEGLNVGVIDYVPSEFSNLVLGQQINGQEVEPGVMVNKGSRVDLRIGKSSSGEKTVVPNLFGETLSQARSEIASLFLNVGAIIYDETVQSQEDSLNAKVWQQRPSNSRYDEIELGASIDVWLTLDDSKLIQESDMEMTNDSTGGF